MSDSKKIISLVLILAATTLTATGIVMFMLYRTALEAQRASLIATAQSQARLIEEMSDSDASDAQDLKAEPQNSTLHQTIEAHKRYRGFGQTGELSLVKRQGDNMVFLLSHRRYEDQGEQTHANRGSYSKQIRLRRYHETLGKVTIDGVYFEKKFDSNQKEVFSQ